MDAATLGLFAAALLVNAGTPGPSIAALVARVISRGIGSILPFLLAMWIGELLWLAAAVLGLGFLAQSFGTLFTVIKLGGVAYLLFLAWRMWTAPVDPGEASLPETRAAGRLFLTGLAITLGNPKIMVFYLALLPAIVDLDAITTVGLGQLLAVAFAVLLAVDLGWALAAAWARGLLRTPRAMRIANRTAATAMGGAAFAIASR